MKCKSVCCLCFRLDPDPEPRYDVIEDEGEFVHVIENLIIKTVPTSMIKAINDEIRAVSMQKLKSVSVHSHHGSFYNLTSLADVMSDPEVLEEHKEPPPPAEPKVYKVAPVIVPPKEYYVSNMGVVPFGGSMNIPMQDYPQWHNLIPLDTKKEFNTPTTNRKSVNKNIVGYTSMIYPKFKEQQEIDESTSPAEIRNTIERLQNEFSQVNKILVNYPNENKASVHQVQGKKQTNDSPECRKRFACSHNEQPTVFYVNEEVPLNDSMPSSTHAGTDLTLDTKSSGPVAEISQMKGDNLNWKIIIKPHKSRRQSEDTTQASTSKN